MGGNAQRKYDPVTVPCSDKLIQTEDEQYISRLRSQIDKARTERDRESKKYLRLWKAVRKEFGDEKAWELIEKAEE